MLKSIKNQFFILLCLLGVLSQVQAHMATDGISGFQIENTAPQTETTSQNLVHNHFHSLSLAHYELTQSVFVLDVEETEEEERETTSNFNLQKEYPAQGSIFVFSALVVHLYHLSGPAPQIITHFFSKTKSYILHEVYRI
jgi:hypothetical protein